MSLAPIPYNSPTIRKKVLLLENIHAQAHLLFSKQGYLVETLTTALDEDELCRRVAEVSLLGIRSKTQVTARVLAAAPQLVCVGAFCIGVNQIDLEACSLTGVAAFNAPYSNTRSVVELAIGEMILLIRQVIDKNAKMHLGDWDKSSAHSYEVKGKTLGILGYGSIGSQLSVLAEALGMNVIYYDVADKPPIGQARRCATLQQVLQVADVLTIHVDGRKENTNLIGEAELAQMKEGVILLNLARGHVVDIAALVKALKSGKVRGAGLDTFPHEPKGNNEGFESELRQMPNVILTPHIGGSTEEAQLNIGNYVPEKMIGFVKEGATNNSVNFPHLQLPEFKDRGHRLIHVHHNQPGVLAALNQLLANHGINIVGQHLKTTPSIGYVITDVAQELTKAIMDEAGALPGTIKLRLLY
jgi:D-3-phosphoglycerate dehydrogenase / 2-oxoglutarate reductase